MKRIMKNLEYKQEPENVGFGTRGTPNESFGWKNLECKQEPGNVGFGRSSSLLYGF